MDNCYFFAPDHIKPLILGLVEADTLLGSDDGITGMHSSCIVMVQYAKYGLTDSMKPWFDAQLATTVAMASSIDYLLTFVSSQDAGRSVFGRFFMLRVMRELVSILSSAF